MRCRLCQSNRLLSVLDLGATPPCEKFLTADELDLPEPTFPLHLRVCEDCLLLQIPALITPEDTFTEYAYFSSYSDSWVQHAKTFVDDAAERLGLGRRSFVVEVASNDGYLLQHAVDSGHTVPGHRAVGQCRSGRAPTWRADDNGVPGRSNWPHSCATEHRPADLVVANNVYAHIPDLLGFTRSLRGLLADDGWLSIEVHHALNLVSLGQFDTIYHEHFQYYTVLSAMRALATANLAVVDVELIPTHGGSIRVWARPEEAAGTPSPRVDEVLRIEEEAGLHRSTVTCSCDRGPRLSATSYCDSCSTAAPRASESSVTGHPGRATRCSTTAVSAAICSSTPSTAIRTSTVDSRRGHAFRSTIRPRSTRTGPTLCWHCRGTSRPS